MKKILILFLLMSLPGCVLVDIFGPNYSPLKPEVLARIHTVYVSKITKAPLPEIIDSIIGFPGDDSLGKTNSVQYEKFLLAHNIDIKNILRKYMIQELKAIGGFKVINSRDADAIVDVKIDNYGFKYTGEHDNSSAYNLLRPCISLDLYMKYRTGGSILATIDQVNESSPYLGYISLKDALKNPAVVEKSLRQASKDLAILLVSEDILGHNVRDKELAKINNSELLSGEK